MKTLQNVGLCFLLILVYFAIYTVVVDQDPYDYLLDRDGDLERQEQRETQQFRHWSDQP